jgi:hypothetical protein
VFLICCRHEEQPPAGCDAACFIITLAPAAVDGAVIVRVQLRREAASAPFGLKRTRDPHTKDDDARRRHAYAQARKQRAEAKARVGEVVRGCGSDGWSASWAAGGGGGGVGLSGQRGV